MTQSNSPASKSQATTQSNKTLFTSQQQVKRMLIFFTLLIATQVAQIANAFNVDPISAVVFSGPDDSYFGYSVAQHKDRSSHYVLVGAPKARTDQPKTERAGALYRCKPNDARSCQQIVVDPNGSSTILLNDTKVQADDKSMQWFGSSVSSSPESGSIIACAPQYVYFSVSLKRRDPVGTCWVSRGSFTGFLDYSPCRINDQWGHHHLGSCQAGFSSAISKDGSRIFMGAPGSHVWQGQVFAHSLKSDLKNSTSAVNPKSEDDSYLGYSMTLGKFSSSSSGEDVAIGIPHGAEHLGKVMIVDREMGTLRNITGEQMGSYFGYSLATADVNGDGLDDLIIGAPLYYNQSLSHKEPHFDKGRVYVALQSMRNEFSIASRLDGPNNKGRFGTAVANCGDLNRDGLQDIAVGAPYDGPDGHGAVYIFMGRKGGLSNEWDQVIFAESIRNDGNSLRSFGFALSAGQDLDGNGYPDLLVGDYKSHRAVLLKSRPVVNVETSISFQPEYFNLEEKNCPLPNNNGSVTCTTVTYCVKYNGTNVDNKLNLDFNIKLDTENKGAPRLYFLTNDMKTETKESHSYVKDSRLCKSFKIYIVRHIRDKLTPFKIDIDYDLSEEREVFDYTTNAPKLRPVLNKSGPNKLSKTISIQRNCGPDNICVPDLSLKMSANVDSYTIGSQQKILLDVTVRNNGEDAFESMFDLKMPMNVDFNTYNKTNNKDFPICYGAKPEQTGENVLSCDLGNPMPKGEVIKFTVITEPSTRGEYSASDFTFVARVNSSNPEEERHRDDNQVAVGIPVRVEVNVKLSSTSKPEFYDYNSSLRASVGEKITEADIGPEIYHTYKLHNTGPSTIKDMAVNIIWPSKTQNGDYLLYLVDEPITSDKVICKPMPDRVINPLNLKYLKGDSVKLPSSGAKLAARNQPSVDNNSNDNSNNSDSKGILSYLFSRSKRQTTMDTPNQEQPAPTSAAIVTPTTVDNSIISHQLNLLNCGPTQCDRFECNIINLGNKEVATIEIRSRLWEENLAQMKYQDFDISSRLVGQIKSLPYNVSSQSMAPYLITAETHIRRVGLSVQDLLPWWLILLAILLGISLFICLAYFLKYLGFFARQRPPKAPEREPLTPAAWNDYQYSPGDTAL